MLCALHKGIIGSQGNGVLSCKSDVFLVMFSYAFNRL